MKSVIGSPTSTEPGASSNSRIVVSCGPWRFFSIDRLAHAAGGLEMAQQEDGVGEIADLHRPVDPLADHAVLVDDQ